MFMARSQSFKTRLGFYLKDKNIKTRTFEKVCGLSNGYFSKLVNFPSEDKMRVILCNAEDINPLWLFTGEGNMYKTSTPIPEDKNEPETEPDDLVPELPVNAAAGFTDDLQSGITPSMCSMMPRIPGVPRYDLTMQVRGDSMQPTFESGDRLAIRRCYDFVEWGSAHVLDTTEGVYLKRIREAKDDIVCISDNADYPQFNIPKHCVRGIYKVVALLRVC